MKATTNRKKKKYVDCIQYTLTVFSRLILKVFWIFPIKRNRVFCEAFTGSKYACNPKYISEYLSENYPGEFELVWVFRDLSICKRSDIRAVKLLSLKHFYYFATAQVIINNCGMPTYMPKRKRQYFINTWHGGGAYKKDDPVTMNESKQRRLLVEYKTRCVDLLISSCEMFSRVLPGMTSTVAGTFVILPSGMPRNDILFSDDRMSVRNKVCDSLQINKKKLICMYAPTYRGMVNWATAQDGCEKFLNTDIDIPLVCAALQKRFDMEAVFVLKLHHNLKGSNVYSNVVDASDYPDMQELLYAADVLISDYSSTIWDFSLMKKPCFLYVPDLAYYAHEDRGFFTPIETWPGVIAQTNEELRAAILGFDEVAYREKVEKHHRDLGSYETGTACKQVCERIAQVCGPLKEVLI